MIRCTAFGAGAHGAKFVEMNAREKQMKNHRDHDRWPMVLLVLAIAILAGVPAAVAQQHHAPAVKSLRLYIFDCGMLKIADPARYHLKPEEMATTDMSVPCFLVAHPKGTMMWDVGVIPDSRFKPDGVAVTVEYPTSVATVTKPLLPQLASLG